jgi:large subunit ribosomal protein L29
MDANALKNRLIELKKELNLELGKAHSAGKVQSPGRLKEIKKTIARILTIMKQKEKEVKNSE